MSKMKSILEQGYGVTHTLKETAEFLGISRERVRQIEKCAFSKIRQALIQYYGTDKIEGIL